MNKTYTYALLILSFTSVKLFGAADTGEKTYSIINNAPGTVEINFNLNIRSVFPGKGVRSEAITKFTPQGVILKSGGIANIRATKCLATISAKGTSGRIQGLKTMQKVPDFTKRCKEGVTQDAQITISAVKDDGSQCRIIPESSTYISNEDILEAQTKCKDLVIDINFQ